MIGTDELDLLESDLPLSTDAICLWSIDLDRTDSRVVAAIRILSEEEQQRAARFRREPDRKHFIVGHAVLRLILSHYLETDPREITFAHNPYGKPRLRNNEVALDVRFSLAHSDSLALCAVAIGREVGVDLEAIRPDGASMEMARTFFAPEEVIALSALSGNDFVSAFYRCWTRKEAYVKAKGLGLSLPLSSFVVSVEQNEARLLRFDYLEPGARLRWTVLDLPGIQRKESFAAAIAVEIGAKSAPQLISRDYFASPSRTL